MKINKFAFILLGAFSLQALHALEEVVVTSSIIGKSSSEILDPIHILSGMRFQLALLKVWARPLMSCWESQQLTMALQ
jgi:hypothetical protein